MQEVISPEVKLNHAKLTKKEIKSSFPRKKD